MDLEEELKNDLTFKRFSPEKQEQIRQLVAYTALMGLDGKDLVSIGGKLDRIAKRQELDRNLEIGRSYVITPVGKNQKERNSNKNTKWYFVDSSGKKWRFDKGSYSFYVFARNCETNVQRQFEIYSLVSKPVSNFPANVMANYHHGHIKLNF